MIHYEIIVDLDGLETSRIVTGVGPTLAVAFEILSVRLAGFDDPMVTLATDTIEWIVSVIEGDDVDRIGRDTSALTLAEFLAEQDSPEEDLEFAIRWVLKGLHMHRFRAEATIDGKLLCAYDVSPSEAIRTLHRQCEIAGHRWMNPQCRIEASFRCGPYRIVGEN